MTEHGFDRAARLIKEARSNAEVTLDDPRVSETIRKTFDGTAEAVEVDWQAGPLDPSKVKAGDTAEIRSGETVVRGRVNRTDLQPRGVILWFEKLLGGYWVDDADDEEPFRLTDHQPAPEPEPAWADGTFGDALVDGVSVRGFIANGGESFVFPLPDGGYHEVGHGAYSDFVPDEPRPLPTRDELAKAITRGTRRSSDDRAIIHKVNGHAAADRVLDLLNGAS